LKLQQLRYLIAIADNGLNITAAANRLYTSQPGVSKQLRLLEEELGVELFRRHGRILGHARLITREVDGIRSMARGLIDEGHADLDEPLNSRLHIVATRQKGPLTRSRQRRCASRLCDERGVRDSCGGRLAGDDTSDEGTL
jgi:DNA-binding transcriptional LysR family regulator